MQRSQTILTQQSFDGVPCILLTMIQARYVSCDVHPKKSAPLAKTQGTKTIFRPGAGRIQEYACNSYYTVLRFDIMACYMYSIWMVRTT
ncbi:hypothetical protein M404DRAFT_934230 [Pisolithus tinctorius Marx 270]|uniref:Uncharacterized protein n=1 Tax=Pisolithus tinctorius Marx 270 TaxID=870435 RepID=A0A0C3NK23_PISTI|nr:hypothetical protein M404DRAFT_934230 [Pisolithus tinctorius Marx 270]